jgi:hypothetical protein
VLSSLKRDIIGKNPLKPEEYSSLLSLLPKKQIPFDENMSITAEELQILSK